MKKSLPLLFILTTLSFTSYAGNTLKEQCVAANGIYVETTSIAGVNNTINSEGVLVYNIAVMQRDSERWYTVDAKTKGHIAQLAEIAMLTKNSVNTCEDFNETLLYGIELKPL